MTTLAQPCRKPAAAERPASAAPIEVPARPQPRREPAWRLFGPMVVNRLVAARRAAARQRAS